MSPAPAGLRDGRAPLSSRKATVLTASGQRGHEVLPSAPLSVLLNGSVTSPGSHGRQPSLVTGHPYRFHLLPM